MNRNRDSALLQALVLKSGSLQLQEIKAKEMEELAKTLAELGIAAQDEEAAGGEAAADALATRRKKKKKKPKAEGNGEVHAAEMNGTAKENEPVAEPEEEEVAESIDPAEVIPTCWWSRLCPPCRAIYTVASFGNTLCRGVSSAAFG